MKIQLKAFRNVEAATEAAFQWQAISGDPQFLIEGWEQMREQVVRFSFRLATKHLRRSPCVLYVDVGAGLSEQGAIYFNVDPDGFVDQEIVFPASLRGLRFDAVSHPGLFSVLDLRIEIVGGVDQAEPDSRRIVVTDKNIGNGPSCAGNQVDLSYDRWIENNEPSPANYPRYRECAARWAQRPLISIAMPTYNTPAQWLQKAIESVAAQVYDRWELCVADDCSTEPHVREMLDAYAARDPRIKVTHRETNGHISAASNTAIEMAAGEYVGLLDHDDELHPLALFHMVEAINARPDAVLLYSDEDKISVEGVRSEPYFKCDLNYALFLSQNMICHFSVYKTAALREVGGFRIGFEGAQDYDLALRVMDAYGREAVHHVPRVLYHWRLIPQSTASSHEVKPYASTAAHRAIADHLVRIGVSGTVEPAPRASGFNKVVYSLPEKLPRVEIIIPTRDAAVLVRQCVDSIREKTTYANYVITIIDNGSTEQSTFDLFASYAGDAHIRVSRDESPFNYSRINNRVALASDADFVCLMNNDIEVIDPDWLTEMVSLAVQDRVGAVGAKLLYPDDTVQHAGVIVGLGGVAGHSHKHSPRHAPGYFYRLLLRSDMSAVTAACLLIRASIYMEVGGLDEQLEVAFNDVDFCLRVQRAGYRNVWTPYAELYHHESASRGYEDTPEKKARFDREIAFVKSRWGEKLLNDRCYSPNLTLDSEDFAIAMYSRVPGSH